LRIFLKALFLFHIMKSSTKDLIDRLLKKDKRALARLMTFVENRHVDLLELMSVLSQKTGSAEVVGITGPPGAGKSTLVDKLIRDYRKQGKTVGVLAIDPSSPFSGGAVLGDRIRMQDHSADPHVFIRSVGSRGAHGGLSRATQDLVLLFDAYGFDVILVETASSFLSSLGF
jgi:LAO/AO transport system kinase